MKINRSIPQRLRPGRVAALGLALLLLTAVPSVSIAAETVSAAQAAPAKAGESKVLTGKVLDSDGAPLIGANVIEQGNPANGVTTNIDGTFRLRVGANAVIEVSYLGYAKKEVATDGRTFVEVALAEDTNTLDDVVVVGYGSQKKISV
ncbi:MAG: carboxypeptidase-like regulatory domain-containing protein, partial [Alistipes sp.]|nr:carboxypeptidase-like regulatory domain-containing protein [Alistipes sp.]